MSPPRPTAKPHSDESAIRNYPRLLKRYERIMEIGRGLASTLDHAELLRRIIEAAQQLTDTEAASILLVDSLSGELRFEAATSHAAAAMERVTVPLEGSIAGWIVTHGQPLVVADTARDPRFFRGVDEITTFATRSVLGVPLKTKDRVIGALEALNKKAGAFTPDDVSALEALAGQAAVAIENARLFQQSDLIAEMVHELRTPLASLAASAHLLLHPHLPEAERRGIVETMQAETDRLTHMTTEFLDLARLESGRVRFHREPFDLSSLLAESAAQVAPQAASRGIVLVNAVTPGPAVFADRSKIKQVLLNLLTNAVKYNRDGGRIELAARAEAGFLHVSVSDTGRGIPPESMPHIFEKFYRVAASEGTAPGTGLGLAIARRIVETLGGEMRVVSQVDVGTTFTFTMPLADPGGIRVREPHDPPPQ